METKGGGWSEIKPATTEIQKICDVLKKQVEEKTHKNYKEFKATEYRDQIVSGKNYLIRVLVGEPNYLCLQVYESFLPNVKLTGLAKTHTKGDPLEPIN